eukprot:1843341-Ditylum_brightwellii.AAC.1
MPFTCTHGGRNPKQPQAPFFSPQPQPQQPPHRNHCNNRHYPNFAPELNGLREKDRGGMVS